MLLKLLTCIAVWILIPDYVFLQTVSRNKIHDEHVPCEYGWYNFKEKCFRVSGAREHLDWHKAAEHCQVVGAKLATVESLEENDFLVGLLLLEVQGSAWIGLHDQVNESDYLWQSGSQSDFRNWRPSEPSGDKLEHEDCVQLLVDLFHDSVGQWNDNDCKHRTPYICEKKSSPEKSSPNLKNCSSADGGGFRFKNSCFHLVNELKSWDDAEKHCIDKYGGHLMTILDKAIDFYLKYELQGNNAELWTGIKIRNQFQQQWSSGWYVGYNGLPKESTDFVEGICVIRKHRQEWDIVSCSKKYAFICEKSSVKAPVLKPPPKDSFCPSIPSGWRDLGGEFCYYIEASKPTTWSEANFECIRRDGHLASLHSKEESDILSPFILFSLPAYIGLIRHYKEKDAFKWSDGSELDFKNWSPGEPNSGNEVCVETRSADMKWNDINCSSKRSYICSVRKISPTTTVSLRDLVSPTTTVSLRDLVSPTTTVSLRDLVTPNSSIAPLVQDHFELSTPPNSTTAGTSHDKVKVSGHLSRKIIIGVVVCILLVAIIIGIAVFKFRLFKKKSMDTRLHYQDMTSNEQDY